MMQNLSVTVTELLGRSLENACKEAVSCAVSECSKVYGFDVEEALRMLCLDKLVLHRKAMAKRGSGEKKRKLSKSKECPLPFMEELVDVSLCQGLSFNHGLFTQCHGSKMSLSAYCAKCQSQADKNSSGKPDCGNVVDRIGSEFKDCKGRKPSNYAKVISKLGFSEEQARASASSANIVLDDSYFVVPDKKAKSDKSSVKSDGKRGRPKKTSVSVEASSVNDLFAQLTTDADDMSEMTTSSAGNAKLSAEEKSAKKAELKSKRDAEKAVAQQERDAKRAAAKAAEKAERDAKRAAEKEAEKAERDAKKAAEKALAQQTRDSKKASEKALAQQMRDAKKVSAKKPEAVSSEGVSSEAVSAATPEAVSAATPEAVSAAPAATKLSVSIVTIDGVQYYKVKTTNVIMDKKTKAELGTYDEKNNKIIPFPEDDELDVEESEDEYEEDDE